MTGDVAYFLVENGTVHTFDLPVPPWATQRITTGVWRRVNADGSLWTPAPGLPPPMPPRPTRNDPKSAWLAYAIRVHGMKPDDAEALTKQDLIERLGPALAVSSGGSGD